jgi:hypothetical protein
MVFSARLQRCTDPIQSSNPEGRRGGRERSVGNEVSDIPSWNAWIRYHSSRNQLGSLLVRCCADQHSDSGETMLPFSLIVLLHSLLVVALPPGGRSPQTKAIGRIQTRPTLVYKPRSLELLHKKRLRGRTSSSFPDYQEEDLQWDALEVVGPNVEDRHTLAQLARMAGNAYALPGQSNWYEVDPAWRMVRRFTPLHSRGVLIDAWSELSVWMGQYRRWV